MPDPLCYYRDAVTPAAAAADIAIRGYVLSAWKIIIDHRRTASIYAADRLEQGRPPTRLLSRYDLIRYDGDGMINESHTVILIDLEECLCSLYTVRHRNGFY